MQLTVGQADSIIRVYYLIHQNNTQQLVHLSVAAPSLKLRRKRNRQVRGKKKSSVTNRIGPAVT